MEIERIDIQSDTTVKVLVVGDLHLHYLTPKSRLDDYPTTCLDKLEQIRNICNQNGIREVILLGDIFHRPNQPIEFLYRVISEFRRFADDCIELFTIVGNHDIKVNSLDTLNRSALGVLFLTGLLQPFSVLSYKLGFEKDYRLNFLGYNYTDKVQPVSNLPEFNVGDFNVAVAHKFYNFNLADSKENLTEEDIINDGYDAYLLGHDHVVYDDLDVQGRKIVRPGSLLRGTSHKYELDKEVQVRLLTFTLVDSHIEMDSTPIVLNYKPSQQVFSSIVTDKNNLKELSKDLNESFSDLITMLEQPKQGRFDVYQIVDSLKIDNRVLERIEFYLTSSGIFRQSV